MGPPNENAYCSQSALGQGSGQQFSPSSARIRTFKIEQYTGLVLNYLRLQSFHDDLVIESVNLEELVRCLVKKYSLFIQGNTSLDLGQLDRTVKTDKRWLGLLIEQILSNALKYCQGKNFDCSRRR